MKHKILSTRKISPQLLQEAEDSGLEIITREFISIRPLLTEQKKQEVLTVLQNETVPIIITSSNAVDALENYQNRKKANNPFYCLSGKTAESIKAIFVNAVIKEKADNAGDLAKKIMRHPPKEVVFFCGNRRRDELPNLLRAAGVRVREIVVYETIDTPVFLDDTFDAVLFFSPSAVTSFFSANKISSRTVCFAIGRTTAAAIAAVTANKVITSEGPATEMMLHSVQSYFHTART